MVEEEGRCNIFSRIYNQQDPVLAETPFWDQVKAWGNIFSFPILLKVDKQGLDSQRAENTQTPEQVKFAYLNHFCFYFVKHLQLAVNPFRVKHMASQTTVTVSKLGMRFKKENGKPL